MALKRSELAIRLFLLVAGYILGTWQEMPSLSRRMDGDEQHEQHEQQSSTTGTTMSTFMSTSKSTSKSTSTMRLGQDKPETPAAAAFVQSMKSLSRTTTTATTTTSSSSSSSNYEYSYDPTRSAFDQAAEFSYQKILDGIVDLAQTQHERKHFDLKKWRQKTRGGLEQTDRQMLGDVYHKAQSVFEFGLGESTYIANHVGVPRYAGVDSDPQWIAMARKAVATHFRFYLADIGPTGSWGFPTYGTLPKAIMDYQVAPLFLEPLPFDVYVVDGRWRVGCLLLSFLHASARGSPHNATVVYVHDCQRQEYHLADASFNVTLPPNGGLLCEYRRWPDTTDQQIMNLWLEHHEQLKR